MRILKNYREKKESERVAKSNAQEEKVNDLLSRIYQNINNLTEIEAKEILTGLSSALVTLFVKRCPKLLDDKLTMDEKMMPFLMSIAGLAADTISAYGLAQTGFNESLDKLQAEFSNLKELEKSLSLLSK